MPGKVMRNPRSGVVFLLLLAGCGAAAAGRANYLDPNMDFAAVRSVAVMPLVNLTAQTTASERVRDVFMTMLQATGGVYVIPSGEVARGVSRAGIANAAAPAPEEVVRLAKIVNADAVITGTVREYGEVRAATTQANIVSLSLQMLEGQTGKVVWSASSTQGGVTTMDRLFGGGGSR